MLENSVQGGAAEMNKKKNNDTTPEVVHTTHAQCLPHLLPQNSSDVPAQ